MPLWIYLLLCLFVPQMWGVAVPLVIRGRDRRRRRKDRPVAGDYAI